MAAHYKGLLWIRNPEIWIWSELRPENSQCCCWMISGVVGIDYYISIRWSFAYIRTEEVVKNVHVKKVIMNDTFVCDDTFLHDDTVAYLGFTCIKTYMNACYTYRWQSVREMSNRKDKYAITVYKLEGVVGHILCIILSCLT